MLTSSPLRVGNFVGPLLFKAEDAPVYAPGFMAVVITSVLVIVLSIVYRYLSIWENRKRDKAGILEAYEHGRTSMSKPVPCLDVR